MTTNDILLGIGLVLVLAVGSQLLARRLRIPAIVVLLPAGFIAGIATDYVHPEDLLGDLYQPFVSLAVGIILFEAGLRLSFASSRSARTVVMRLVVVGVVVTCAGVAVTFGLLLAGMSNGVAFQVGAILVVSGPTVVLPLLAFIRPARAVRSALKWEGVLVDPVGALLGVAVFHLVSSGWEPGEFLLSSVVGAAVGTAGAALLGVLREVHLNQPRMAVLATLMVVVAAVVAADLLREDSGFPPRRSWASVSATNGGSTRLAGSTSRSPASSRRRSCSCSSASCSCSSPHRSPERRRSRAAGGDRTRSGDGLLLRPVVVVLATWRSSLTWRERGFLAWMAPRGIVAGATASAFGLELQEDGIAGADLVLPIVFVVIFATVVLYGLTAPLVARRLHVAGNSADWCSSSAAMTGRVTSPSLSRSPGPRCACGWGRRPIERPRGQRASRPTTAA